MHLAIEFQEEYKRLDRLCKDILSSADGVTEYIKTMDRDKFKYKRYVSTWEDDYEKLKHIRWVRNQLAHEVGAFESGVCKQNDLEYVKAIYMRILNVEDPLAQGRKRAEEDVKKIIVASPKQYSINSKTEVKPSGVVGLLKRIKEFFTGKY